MNFITLALWLLSSFQPASSNTIPNATEGRFDSIQVNISQWGHKAPAVIYQPEPGVPGKTYPLIVCFHGKSIAGKGVNKLYETGILQQLKMGRKIQAVSKTDNKLYKFIVLAPQAPTWSFGPENFSYILDDVLKRYPIDKARVYVTGYSAGGWSTVMAITHSKELSDRITAAVPMSPSPIDEKNAANFKVTADANIHSWYFAGTAEPLFLEASERYLDSTNKYKPGLARMTLHDKGHCCWKDFYNPAYREGGINIYEWMILFRKK